MNSLYNQALKQANSLRRDLDAFQEQISPSTSSSTAPTSPGLPSSATALQGQIQVGLTSLSKTIDDYDGMAQREIIATKQEKAFSRVKEFRAELANLRTRFDSLKRLHSESTVSQNRNELFGRRPFHSSTPENPYDTRIRTNAGLTREEGMLRENTFLQRTEAQLDEFIGRGISVLDNLVEQRGFLKA